MAKTNRILLLKIRLEYSDFSSQPTGGKMKMQLGKPTLNDFKAYG